jgi:hypothetical protein
MNQRSVVLVGLIVVLAGVFYWFVLREDPKMREARERMAAGAQQPMGPAGAEAASGAPGAVPQSKFQRVEVNLDELLSRIQEVEFDYDRERMARNPMTPLVGPEAAPRTLDAEAAAPGDTSSTRMTEVMARQMRLTGIIWESTNPLAIIEDEVVSQGYEFPQGVVVEAIEPDRVMLRFKDSLIPLMLKEP